VMPLQLLWAIVIAQISFGFDGEGEKFTANITSTYFEDNWYHAVLECKLCNPITSHVISKDSKERWRVYFRR
jgi:hypothetical protein